MAIAGRILIMPKGNYDASVTYEMLDLVKHNGTSWLAKKTVVGIEPSEANAEYWQKMFDININIVNDLNAEEEGSVLDATQGKILDEKISNLNDDFVNKFKRTEVEFHCPVIQPLQASIVGNISEYNPSGYEVFSISILHSPCAYWNNLLVSINTYGEVCVTNTSHEGVNDDYVSIKLILVYVKSES